MKEKIEVLLAPPRTYAVCANKPNDEAEDLWIDKVWAFRSESFCLPNDQGMPKEWTTYLVPLTGDFSEGHIDWDRVIFVGSLVECKKFIHSKKEEETKT